MTSVGTTEEIQRFTCPEDVVDRDLGEDLLVHKAATDEVFILNAHARLVFEEAKQAKTRDEVCVAIAGRGFAGDGVPEAIAGALEEMLRDGILVPAEPTAAG